MRDCANCFHRKPVLKDDGTWTAECEKWDCEFQSRENMIEKTKITNNDLISRSALREAFEDLFYNDYDDQKRTERLIDNAPTVEIATKLQPNCNNLQQGEWIVLVDADNIQTCKCSICGRMADIANHEFEKFPYCHCGAKMKGEDK